MIEEYGESGGYTLDPRAVEQQRPLRRAPDRPHGPDHRGVQQEEGTLTQGAASVGEVLIHPTAIVAASAELAPDVSVGAYAIVGPQVRIGAGTVDRARTSSSTATRRSATENRIFPFASVGAMPQDLKYHGEDSELVIGDRNHIREFCTLNPGTAGGGMITRVGDDNLFMNYVHVAHDCRIGQSQHPRQRRPARRPRLDARLGGARGADGHPPVCKRGRIGYRRRGFDGLPGRAAVLQRDRRPRSPARAQYPRSEAPGFPVRDHDRAQARLSGACFNRRSRRRKRSRASATSSRAYRRWSASSSSSRGRSAAFAASRRRPPGPRCGTGARRAADRAGGSREHGTHRTHCRERAFPVLFAATARAEGLAVVAVAHEGETDPEIDAHVDQRHVDQGRRARRHRARLSGPRGSAGPDGGRHRQGRADGALRSRTSAERACWRGCNTFSDDTLLRGVAAELEAEGIEIVESTLFLPSLLAPGASSPGAAPTRRSGATSSTASRSPRASGAGTSGRPWW